jgi:glycosyltransferase involved in cell wall biosynthesis
MAKPAIDSDAFVAIIPCFNAGARIRPVVEGVCAALARVIVVDDGSTDGAVEGLSDLPIQVVRLEPNRGKGHAILAGIRAALEDPAAQAVLLLDADGQHDPAEIPRFTEAYLAESPDLIIGRRVFDKSHVPLRSRFGNKVTVAVTAWLLGQRLPDTQCGYRLLSRAFAEAVCSTVRGGRYETEMEIIIKAVREGYQVTSIPIETIYEPGNASSHFRKVQDSIRIYRRLFGAALRR